MSPHNASSGSCTTATPPRCLTAMRPAVPSSSAPESTTPITRAPWKRAAVRNRASTAGRCRPSRALRVRRTTASTLARTLPGRQKVSNACLPQSPCDSFGAKGGSEAAMSYKIALVDDHRLFREGLRALLASQPDLQVVGEAAEATEACALV